MGVTKFFREFIYKLDFFYTAEVLRVRSQPDYKTLLGGLTSIAIIVALLVLFYTKIIDTLDKILITSSLDATVYDDPTPFHLSTYDEGKFMFGVEIWKHDLNVGPRYFDVILRNTYYINGDPMIENNNTRNITLEPCTRSHWAGYPQILQKFDRIRMHQWQCLPKNSTYEIYGKFSSKESMTLDVSVNQCTNRSSEIRPCASPQEIEALFTSTGNFYYTIYFLNALINPSSKNHLNYYLEDSNYVFFNRKGGEEAQLWVQDFTITTDESIIPFSSQVVDQGGIITNNAIKNHYDHVDGLFATFFIFKSPRSLTIGRSFQKLDEVLAYIGGLFGAISIAFFLVSIYNEYSFQIAIAGYLYNNKDEEKQKMYKKYNFAYFMAELVYGVLRRFKLKPNWPTVKEFYLCSQQMVRQLDILYLLKRVNFLERSIELLVDDHQIKGLHFMKQTTLNEAKNIRMKYKLRTKLKRQLRKRQKQLKSSNQNDSSIKIQQNNKNNEELHEFQANKHSVFPEQRLQHQSMSLIPEQINEIEENQCYSSEEQLSDDQNHENNELSLIQSMSILAEERKKNDFSKRIWQIMDEDVKENISRHLRINEDNKMKIQSSEYLFQEENLPNNFILNETQPKHSSDQSIKLDNDAHKHFQMLQKSRNLPKLQRKNAGRIMINQIGIDSISLATQNHNKSMLKVRKQERQQQQNQRYK